MTSYVRLLVRPLIAMAFLGVARLPASAQTRSTWSLQGSVLYAGLRGKAYEGIDAGAGFELQARRKLDPYWSLGCGLQNTYHSFESFTGNERLQGLFCEPRRLIDINSENVFPYVSVRAGFLRQRLESGTLTSTASGAALNVGGGIVMPIANTAGNYPTLLEIGASGGYSRFGNFAANGPGPTVDSPRQTGSGWNFVMRLGLAVGLPFGNAKK